MSWRFTSAASVVWVLIFSLSLLTSQAMPYQLSLGVYSSHKPKEAAAQFLPFTKALQAVLSRRFQQPVEINLSVMQTYEDSQRFVREGDVDFLELGAASYVLAKSKNPDLELLAVRCPSDAKQLVGVICVRTNSPITSIAELKGKSFAFGDRRSTTGHFLSQWHLYEQGILAKDLSKQTHLGSHREVAAAIASGQYEAGALNMIEHAAALRNGQVLRILSRFPNFGRPWVCRNTLPTALKEALKQSLLEMADNPSIAALGDSNMTIMPAQDLDFESLREAIRKNGLFHGKRESLAQP